MAYFFEKPRDPRRQRHQGLFLICLALLLSVPWVQSRGGGGCFLPDTQVQTPHGLSPINQLAPGDLVLTDSQGQHFVPVLRIYQVQAPEFIELISKTSAVNVTPEHLIGIAPGRFQAAGYLQPGQSIEVQTGNQLTADPIVSASIHAYNGPAYNLLVAGQNTFLANGILAHNKGCFMPDTPVVLADGTTQTISTLHSGQVLAAFTETGDIVNATLLDVFSVEAPGYYVIQTGQYTVNVTGSHPFYVGNGTFQTAETLEIGQSVYVFNGSALIAQSIQSKTWVEKPIRVYNLHTDRPNTFFANFIAVHNKGGGGCFTAGTQIRTPDGTVPIESLQEGQAIISIGSQGKPQIGHVQRVVEKTSLVLRLTTRHHQVDTTDEHPFLTQDGLFVNASDLHVGQRIMVFDQGRVHAEIITSKQYQAVQTVYNLEVDAPHTFVADGFVVHNKGYYGSSSYDPNTQSVFCGQPLAMQKAGGSIVSASQCFQEYYAKANQAKADALQSCVQRTTDAWNQCGSLTSFAITTQKGIQCQNENDCQNQARFTFPDGSSYPIFHPPGLLDILLGFIVSALMFLLWPAIIVYAIISGRKNKNDQDLDFQYPKDQIDAKEQKTAKVLAYLSNIDPAWKPDALTKTATNTFVKLQQCWQAREYGPMQPLLIPYLYDQHVRQLDGMKQNHEINKIENLTINRVSIVQVKAYRDKKQQEFTVLFDATAKDYYVDDRTGKFLRGDTAPTPFQEFWVFHRQGNDWVLREIDQTRESNALKTENFVEELTPQQLQNLYGPSSNTPSTAAPWTDAGITDKSEKISRLLNFWTPLDKTWDEDYLKSTASTTFAAVLHAFEKRDLGSVQSQLSDEAAKSLQNQIQAMISAEKTVQYRNLCVRKVDIVWVQNKADKNQDEFTCRISAHAQTIEKTGAKTTRADEYVQPFEQYWTFQRSATAWKLLHIEPPAAVPSILRQENVDDDSTPAQMQWYYTKDRAA